MTACRCGRRPDASEAVAVVVNSYLPAVMLAVVVNRSRCACASRAASPSAPGSPLRRGFPPFAAPKVSAAWAKHSGPFTDADFEGFSTTDSGLQYKIVEEGYGVKPAAGQNIKAHYSGYLLNGEKFDSSYDRRSPLAFAVGTGRVIKGWDEALLDMKVGELRMLKIPAALGYGSRGAGGIIPADATLVFYVELVTLAM